ncbi:MAG TPA: glycosyltransferase family 39 protein [Bacteroidales bacterium]|nr:glycosyltransferase family 39 protein [Bacteroidales bacterium]
MRKITHKQLIVLILLGALCVRLIFTIFVAQTYFGKPDFYVMGDTQTYMTMATNLVDHGSYSTSPDNLNGVASRLPGYPLLLSIVYLICGRNILLSFFVVITLQILADVLSAYFLYRISLKYLNSKRIALLSMLLYSIYPFIIVWVPVVATETFSVFFMLWGLLILGAAPKIRNCLIGGALLAVSVFMRPQISVLIVIFILVYLITHRKVLKKAMVSVFLMALGFGMVYSPWVIRNYILLDQLVIFQKISGGIPTFNRDVKAVRSYIYSIKTEWDPQFFQIVRNEAVDWPEIAYISKEDSLMLRRAEYLAKNCGSGISCWAEYWNMDNKRMSECKSCNDSIVYYFTTLRKRQIEANPFHYHVVLPAKNLGKALFKTGFTKESRGGVLLIGNILFLFRSLLLILGLIGVFIMMKRKILLGYVIFIFWATVYFYLCYVTRNLEMRYFLNNDVLMLIPAAYLLHLLWCRLRKINTIAQDTNGLH